MKKFILLQFVIINCIFSLRLNAQLAGDNDSTFNPGDFGFGIGDGPNSHVYSIAEQPNGKLIVSGSFFLYNGITVNNIVRLQSDGTPDTTFMTGSGLDAGLQSIIFQTDGKMIIAGGFTTYNGFIKNHIARLNPDGTLDQTFDGGLGTNNPINCAVLQNDGKTIIGGEFTTYNGIPTNRITRIHTDGKIDNSFNTGSGADQPVETITIQTDEKIIVGGSFTSFNGTAINRICRLNSDGSPDNTFKPGTGADDAVYASILQQNGKIIIAGDFTTYNGSAVNRICRLNTDGSLDTTFKAGIGVNSSIKNMFVQPDGKILISGGFTTYNGISRNGVARLHADGSLDTSFNPGGGASDAVYVAVTQNDGRMIIGGKFESYDGTPRMFLARLLSNGAIDPSFNRGGGANSGVLTTVVQPDGKILIGGFFRSFNGTTTNHLARLNNNGTLDPTFKSGLSIPYSVSKILLQPDEKILISGDFTTYNGIPSLYIARLYPDGTPDTTFKAQTSEIHGIYAMALQNDGKIIVGGNWNPAEKHLARLNADGSLDSAFHTGTGANWVIQTITLQKDGKIIIGGYFSKYNEQPVNYIARLNSDGTLDPTFDTGMGTDNYVQTTLLQDDGKIIIGGAFHLYDGIPRTGIARLHTDGKPDLSFNPDIITSVYVTVRAITMQGDGKIIAGGGFTFENGSIRNNIVRLNEDGTVDTTFEKGSGTDFYIQSMAQQKDGKIIIGGDFTFYNHIGRNRIARIWGSNITGTDDIDQEESLFSIYPNPASSALTILFYKSLHNARLKLISLTGQTLQEKTNLNGDRYSFDISSHATGFYILEIEEAGHISRCKLVKE